MYYSKRATRIKMVIFDVDGVLTDGTIVVGTTGEFMKNFNCQDGLGISLLHKAGIKTAIITGRTSEIVKIRSQELNITEVYQGVANKLSAFHMLKEKYHLEDDTIAYVGDDLIDLPVMLQVGLACAVDNAAYEVKEVAHYVARKEGGKGAVREIVEMILKSQGKWDSLIETYFTRQPLLETKQ
ncbi:KdsC family phosphatase [Anaerosinus gibii]|uniref:HAD-IIIA family hydrolase n=1 Tax=Selenobaculum gibii TaxID=3054208 RepID=A0A9Y2AJJ1_9FIRM|nr:HAD-IIIA family hydrolase [Selenobaculum gbiensis]WIW71047.1 HAD-IIIA family hydrolase [Selenobaculum gbiensis]